MKPVAWRCRWKSEQDWKYGEKPCSPKDLARKEPGFEEQPLYSTPSNVSTTAQGGAGEALRPCPFCGGKSELVESDTAPIKEAWLVRCTWCQCKTVTYYDNITPRLVWNRRSTPLSPVLAAPQDDTDNIDWDTLAEERLGQRPRQPAAPGGEPVAKSHSATIFDIHTALAAADLEYTGYSCNGVDVIGTKDSIKAVMAAFNSQSQIDYLQTNLRHWREECGKLHAKLASAPPSDERAKPAGISVEARAALLNARALLRDTKPYVPIGIGTLSDFTKAINQIDAALDPPKDAAGTSDLRAHHDQGAT